MPTCKKCSSKFPCQIKIGGKNRNIANRSYCLSCSPFGGHNTAKIERQRQTFKTQKNIPFELKCKICEMTLSSKSFGIYRNRGGWKVFPYCKSCDSIRVKQKQRELKQRCINYKGGQCQVCGYSACLAAMEFHHRNRQEKDLQISQDRRNTKEAFNELKAEMDKCDLLCCRCHRELHDSLSAGIS